MSRIDVGVDELRVEALKADVEALAVLAREVEVLKLTLTLTLRLTSLLMTLLTTSLLT